MVKEIAKDIEEISRQSWSLETSREYCKTLAQTHYENFTVGSFFIPKGLRQHMYHIYAYCRWSDDLGDEIGSQQESLRLLNDWESQLQDCYNGKTSHPVFIALSETIQAFDIPKEPFWRLIQAFKQDQVKTRFETIDEIFNYCFYSANPVGHLVLYLFGYRDPERQLLSDKICTALQLANFWQDVKRDLAIGRIYLPLNDMRAYGVTEKDLEANSASASFKKLLAFEINRTRTLFHEGEKLLSCVEGLFKVDLFAFVQGGMAILDEVEGLDYDILAKRPEVSRMRKVKILVGALGMMLWNKFR